ncbi:TlpA disulfide reductase family protein [Anatilimnocola sp. NA78]|uniref:TlpA disulfide reductase family protein n=1 Tax=Anatilimnocola sp. NA78 TaxID=3415683 RepID=UPI003CE4CB66
MPAEVSSRLWGVPNVVKLLTKTAALLLLLLCVVGCQPQAQSPPNTSEKPVTKTSEPGLDPATISLQVGDETALEDLVKKQAGKVVLVDFWATWCHPCVEGFPHTVDAYEKYQEKGLAAIAVSFDDPDDEQLVRRFLAGQRARFDNLLCSWRQKDNPFTKFGLEQVPHYRLYDRTGKLRHKWDEEPKDLHTHIEALLAEK